MTEEQAREYYLVYASMPLPNKKGLVTISINEIAKYGADFLTFYLNQKIGEGNQELKKPDRKLQHDDKIWGAWKETPEYKQYQKAPTRLEVLESWKPPKK
jgi:hypothetical protein